MNGELFTSTTMIVEMMMIITVIGNGEANWQQHSFALSPWQFAHFQVLQLQEKLTRVEQEREHWSLEAQLMTMKCKKEIEVRCSLEMDSRYG